MRVGRLWPAVVLALFCFPLFIGLGRRDLQGDEAAYSFGVDRILEVGQWLEPKASPNEDVVFVEKPPLGFWIVAAPIRFGLLPNTEFGLRFWDALFGGIAFLYVFGIGRRVAGSVCGAVAVLILFVHDPLLFAHGLRTNNMEAPLFLCYCGGVYHYFAWLSPERTGRRWMHAMAVGLYFVLGFMTKDVAALFLPLVLGLATLAIGAYRKKFFREWRQWAAVSVLVVALVVPWFVYAYMRFGHFLWDIMFAQHVYTRFTSYLDPNHLQPWYFYFVSIYRNVVDSDSWIPVLGGLVLLAVETIRRRWPEGLVMLLWFWLPLCLISVGTSKLYHYAYPFLPPLAIAGGYFVAFLLKTAHPYVERGLRTLDTYTTSRTPKTPTVFERPVVRALLIAVTAVGAVVFAWTLVGGHVRIAAGNLVLFKSGGLVRPLAVTLVCGMLSRVIHDANVVIVPILVVMTLPVSTYRDVLARVQTGEHPMRTASDCVRSVAARPENFNVQVRGMSITGPPDVFGHEHAYYFHRMRPIRRTEVPQQDILEAYLYNSDEQRPVLIAESTYRDFIGRPGSKPLSPPLVDFQDGTLLLVPGPYAVCSTGPARRAVEQ